MAKILKVAIAGGYRTLDEVKNDPELPLMTIGEFIEELLSECDEDDLIVGYNPNTDTYQQLSGGDLEVEDEDEDEEEDF